MPSSTQDFGGKRPVRVFIRIDPAKLKEVEDLLVDVPKGVQTAISGAINKVLGKMRTRLVRATAAGLNLKQKDIRDRMTIARASARTGTGQLNIVKKQVPLLMYGARQNKQGVSVLIRKGRGRELLRHYYINRVKGPPGEAVMKRASGFGGKNGEALASRYPTFKKYGLSVYGFLRSETNILDKELQVSGEELNTQLDSQVDRLLQRKRADR